MKRRAKKKPVPSTAIERLELGRLNAADLVVVARLLDRPDLADAAEALSSAQAWIEETERSQRKGRRRRAPARRTGGRDSGRRSEVRSPS